MMAPGKTIPLKPGTMTMLPEDGLPNDNGGTTMMQRLGSGSAKATVVTESKATVRNRHSFMAGHRLFLSDFHIAAARSTIKFDAKIRACFTQPTQSQFLHQQRKAAPSP